MSNVESWDDRARFLLDLEEIIVEKQVRPTAGRMLITVGNLTRPLGYMPGELLVARVEATRPKGFRVPGGFDYERFLARKGILVVGWCRSPALVWKAKEPRSSFWTTLATFPERLRARAQDFISSQLPTSSSGVMKALLTGDRRGVPTPVLENFQASGAIHLLAISGMHIALLGVVSIGVLQWLLSRSTWLIHRIPVHKAAIIVGFFPLLGYAMITGLAPPAQRALIMTTVFLVAVLLDRQWCSINTLSVAGLLVLAIDPAALFGASFQLSFTATLAIILFWRRLATIKFRPWLRPVAVAFLVSVIATLATAPLVLTHFNRISLISPFTTLTVLPLLFFWSIPLGLFSLFLASWTPGLSGLLLAAAGKGIEAVVEIVSRIATLPFASFYLPGPNLMELMLAYALLFLLLEARRFPAGILKPVAAAFLLAAVSVIDLLSHGAKGSNRIDIIDVGEGAAAVVRLDNGKAVVIDSGGRDTDRFRIGRDLVAPYLWRERLLRLEAVVATHPHADHASGLPFLVEHFQPKKIWISPLSGNISAYRDLLAKAEEKGIPVVAPRRGETIASGAQSELRVVGGNAAQAGFSPNDRSLVLRYQAVSGSALFPADITSLAETHLLEEGAVKPATVLLAPHHGRKGSCTKEFLERVDPAVVVVSTSRPLSERNHCCRDTHCLATSEDGTIRLFFESKGVSVLTADGRRFAVSR